MEIASNWPEKRESARSRFRQYYGYPKNEAAEITVKTVQDFCNFNPAGFDEIIFVCFDKETYGIYKKLC